MDIFVIKTSEAENVEDSLLAKFQKKEISNFEKRKEHCFSYLMLDRILKEVYKIENREIIFDNGKPKLKNGGKYFSLSHSKGYIALGFSDSDCGIDIERVNTNKNWQAIAKRMKFNSQTLEGFYVDWTKYEAEYKLNSQVKQLYSAKIDNYILTAVSENLNEKFDLFIETKKGA